MDREPRPVKPIPRTSRLGRPRLADDEVVFRGLLRTLARLGYAGLSFAALGEQVGLSASALHQRFGSKVNLLRAFIEWNTARDQAAVQARRREGRPPLEAVRAVLGDWSASIGPVEASRMFSVYSELAADPLMREPMLRRITLITDELEALILAAVKAGDLVPCDAPAVARALLVGAAGTMLLTLLTQPEAPLDEQIQASIDASLASYLPARRRARTPRRSP
jgi:AcrR family transcriptional regulator